MAWIESHDNLAGHPKTRRAARALGVSIPTMIGHLHLLWHWCLKYADDGDLSGYDHADIADAMMWDGDPTELVNALLNCGPAGKAGFLEETEDGSLIVHDWFDYAGKLIAKREEAREAGAKGNHERWHVQRGIVDPDCPFCAELQGDSTSESGGDSQTPSGGDSGSDRVLSHRTLPNPTLPNNTKTDIPRAHTREEMPITTSSPDPQPSVGQSPLAPVFDAYRKHLGIMGPSVTNQLVEWHQEHQMEPALLAEAIEITARTKTERRIRGSPDRYLNGVIRGFYNDGIKTMDDLRVKQGPQTQEEAADYILALLAQSEEGVG